MEQKSGRISRVSQYIYISKLLPEFDELDVETAKAVSTMLKNESLLLMLMLSPSGTVLEAEEEKVKMGVDQRIKVTGDWKHGIMLAIFKELCSTEAQTFGFHSFSPPQFPLYFLKNVYLFRRVFICFLVV